MAKKKNLTQAEKKSAHKKNGSKSAAASSTGKEGTKTYVPIRLISSLCFVGLFVITLVIAFNHQGVLPAFIYSLMHGLLGRVGFLVSIPAFLYLFMIHAFSGKRPVIMRSVCIALFVLITGCIAHLASGFTSEADFGATVKSLYVSGAVNGSGGVICGLLAMLFKLVFHTVFSYIILFVGGLITLLASMQITIPSIIRAIQNRPRIEKEEEPEEPKQEPAAVVVNHIANRYIAHKQHRQELKDSQNREFDDEVIPAQAKNKPQNNLQSIMQQIEADVDTPVGAADHEVVFDSNASEDEDAFFEAANNVYKPTMMPPLEVDPVSEDVEIEPTAEAVASVKIEKVTAQDAQDSAARVAMEIAMTETQELPEYRFPPISLLKLPKNGGGDGTAEMRENSRRLNETLASFKIEAHIINVTRGPSVTRYEVELEKGVRLGKLTSAADDIALSLGASGVRIAAVPGKISVVGIEVPNQNVTTVSLREVIDSQSFENARSKSAFAVGKDIGGNCIIGDISKLPHMLIAGTTGSGKSVCMNTIIVSLLYKASPEDVKLIMVDPKMVELGVYNGIPHLLIPVVTDPKKAAGSLQWAVSEMMRRYKAMSDAGVRDLESYNSIMESQEESGKKLPQIVVIIDELADLMLVAAKEVEESICRIAQMGRASGIHLIIATQRPSADVITGLMKANIPSRIAFAVASNMESRIILDTQGAEKLVGKGDMLFAPIGQGKPKRVQGCFVSDSEVEAVSSFVKSNFTSNYDQQVMDDIERKASQTGQKTVPTASDPEANCDETMGDEMLPAAVDVILETGQASVSMLQRRLKLGYARAARIVDEMEEKKIVGPFQGSKPRAILITKEQWASMQSGQSSQLEFEDLEEPDET